MKCLFAGNRRFVLDEVLESGLKPTIAVLADSHLHRNFTSGELAHAGDYVTFGSKAELLSIIEKTDFDIFVSNGCPVILPIADLKPATYVNVHPSLLPDLKGVDPVIGAVLFRRDSGATCHLMTPEIDAGPIISRVPIPYTDDLDVVTLYQLSFIAEREAFRRAKDLNFMPIEDQKGAPDSIYYTRSESDFRISFRESNEQIVSKVKAFNNRSIGCRFEHAGATHKVFRAELMRNPYLRKELAGFEDGVVALSYEGSILFNKDGEVLRFSDIVSPDGTQLRAGDILFTAKNKSNV